MELYKALNMDLSLSRINKRYELSDEFTSLHDSFVRTHDKKYYFTLSKKIDTNRKDRLLLNLQYNNLLLCHSLYIYEDYYRCAEEFFTYFINYEITSGYCSPSFPLIVNSIFNILNMYDV